MHGALKLLHITSALFFERNTQTSLILNSISATKVATQIFLNKRMQKIEDNAYRYSYTIIIVFGILGNILVVLSILRQKENVLKNNYYFFVLHLAICDLAGLILHFYDFIQFPRLKESCFVHSYITCHIYTILDAFHFAGIGMMLIISLIRYRATVHPFKPPISRQKLKIFCGLVYLVGLIVTCGIRLPQCFTKSKVVIETYKKFYYGLWMFFGCFVPTIFMTVVYYKIGRALIKQNKYMKRVCSTDSSFNVPRYIRNRRSFLICLSTVLCYGIACIPMSVWLMWFITGECHLRIKYVWVRYFANGLGVAGSHSINPLIYGILDKKLLTFWKCCRKKKRRTQEN